MDKKENKKPISNTKEEHVKIPKEYLDVLKEQGKIQRKGSIEDK